MKLLVDGVQVAAGLSQADGQKNVRFRFMLAGANFWDWGQRGQRVAKGNEPQPAQLAGHLRHHRPDQLH